MRQFTRIRASSCIECPQTIVCVIRMLSNELFQIVKKAAEDPDCSALSAEAVDDDVHHWRVKCRKFTGPLGEDLTAVQQKYGYNHVELELHFTPDLHPFYPPKVTLVRPRFTGWILGAVMTHPMLALRGWDPMRPTACVLDQVRQMLQVLFLPAWNSSSTCCQHNLFIAFCCPMCRLRISGAWILIRHITTRQPILIQHTPTWRTP
eukprot:SAG31_NODE_2254_length_6073_cov_3.048711_3_plen_206_part_00